MSALQFLVVLLFPIFRLNSQYFAYHCLSFCWLVHYIVCPSIYDLLLSLWYLKTCLTHYQMIRNIYTSVFSTNISLNLGYCIYLYMSKMEQLCGVDKANVSILFLTFKHLDLEHNDYACSKYFWDPNTLVNNWCNKLWYSYNSERFTCFVLGC